MKETAARTFSMAKENRPLPGCTTSRALSKKDGSISLFSMAEHTDISPESYSFPKLWLALDGKFAALGPGGAGKSFSEGEAFVTPCKDPVGIASQGGGVYLEIELKEDTEMNSALKGGEVFALKDLLPYREGEIVNMDLIKSPTVKFALMSFDEGTGLSEHAAPADALVFALEGQAIIGYEGKEYRIKAGENFKFDKMGRHSVKADRRFKIALLLAAEQERRSTCVTE